MQNITSFNFGFYTQAVVDAALSGVSMSYAHFQGQEKLPNVDNAKFRQFFKIEADI
jgi:hypothetical protein